MIKNATFTSVWDDGYEVTTNCKVNMETKEVFDIEIKDIIDIPEELDNLNDEYITIDGKDFDVLNADEYEIKDEDFWYK